MHYHTKGKGSGGRDGVQLENIVCYRNKFETMLPIEGHIAHTQVDEQFTFIKYINMFPKNIYIYIYIYIFTVSALNRIFN